MPTATSMIPAVSLGDPQFTANVHDGIARITELINSELSQADEVMRDTVAHLVDAGGTPFRPLFTVLAAQLGSDPDGWEVTVAGAAIELMHLGTLCHDRVVDESDMSRKTPSDNTRWTNNFAILAGDYRFATASQLASRLDPEAFAVVAEAFAELITGQMRATRARLAYRHDRALPPSRAREDRLSHRSIRTARSGTLRRRRRADPPRSALGAHDRCCV